jgi:hypothetical protein
VHYQSFKDGQHMANRYYRKSAVLHESLLTDPSLAEEENNLNSVKSIDGFDADLDSTDWANGPPSLTASMSASSCSCSSLLFSASVTGPEITVSMRRNADLFLRLETELKDFEGVDKWNLKNFAGGKVSSNEDMLKLGLKS